MGKTQQCGGEDQWCRKECIDRRFCVGHRLGLAADDLAHDQPDNQAKPQPQQQCGRETHGNHTGQSLEQQVGAKSKRHDANQNRNRSGGGLHHVGLVGDGALDPEQKTSRNQPTHHRRDHPACHNP